MLILQEGAGKALGYEGEQERTGSRNNKVLPGGMKLLLFQGIQNVL